MSSPKIEPLSVSIRTRDKIVFEGQALAVSSVNAKGPFDVLPEHANFITLIKDTLVIRKVDKTDQKLTIKNGVMHSADNKISIYLDILSVPTANETKSPQSHPAPHVAK